MKKLFVLLGICLVAANYSVFCQAKESKLTTPEKAYILSRFCTEVKYNFAFYDKLAFNWDSICEASMPQLTSTKTDTDFVKSLQILCAKLRDGHTCIFELNNPSDPSEWIKPFPMKTKRIGDRVFVTHVYSSTLQNQGVTPGCEILRIDDTDVLEYAMKHIQPYLASSTTQWSEYRPFAEFELTKDRSSKVSRIHFRNRKGKEFSLESNREILWDLANNNPDITLKRLKGNIGLLTVSSFNNSQFNRSHFDELYNEVLKTDALIIDIRDNGGGNSTHADYLISHFCDKPVPQGEWSSPMYIAAHGSWNYPKEWYKHKPDSLTPVLKKEIYKKTVVLLVNAATFSSAENLCVSFRGAKRGQIIGTPTGGSTGNPIFLNLGGGIGCCICTKHELDADGNEFVGVGIQPDVVVEDDVNAFLKGKDVVIEKALDLLTAQPSRR